MSGVHPVAISRPQVGIERLPTRRLSNEPRESMNCKSCRKRKIKCNRLRPACEACQVFQCPCIYDAVPKKRGPKTDVLEALLKRVDGLEAKLKEKNAQEQSSSSGAVAEASPNETESASGDTAEPSAKRPALEGQSSPSSREIPVFSPDPNVPRDSSTPPVQTDALLDTYFSRFHAKPYHILDESSVRQRMQLSQLPGYLCQAISAVAARYTPHPGGYQSAVKLSEEFAARSRGEINTDEPSVDALQALLLLVIAFTAAGKGKKAYMLMTSAIGMAMALELHRELDAQARVTPVEREMRRRLFWSCYLLDRYMACGSRRPSLISDKTIMLRLPCWSLAPGALPIEGEFFQCGSNLQHFQGGKKSQGSTGMLLDISRILGVTNRYLASGGVKGDTHFPWHSLSNLSKIRQDLDIWASGTDDVFSSIDSLFGQPDSTVLVLSKLIYHLIHCLIYRPFLPIDLAELAGSGQHQSWQIEATNMCFLHANAIAELIELGKQASTIEWPSFVGYCICTAGTVHIHGAHYNKQGVGSEMSAFSSSADFLSREMQQLSELRYAWSSVQHQRETLQAIYNAHAELVKSSSGAAMRYSSGFHLEDFFDRYANIGGQGGLSFSFNAANVTLSDVVVDFTTDTYTGHDLYAPRGSDLMERPGLKRKNTAPSTRKRPDIKALTNLGPHPPPAPGLPTPGQHRRSFSQHGGAVPLTSPAMVSTPTSMHSHQEPRDIRKPVSSARSPPGNQSNAQPTFELSPPQNSQNSQNSQSIPSGAGGPFSPNYTFAASAPTPNGTHTLINESSGGYDAMFGTLPTNAFTSPAAWHAEESQKATQHTPGGATASPDNRSNNGSTGTVQTDDKDPFLVLLEQLAENEQRFSNNGGGGELDFFLAGTAGAA
ncbi:fungal-specific transcription factor domain-containing protein [Stachybotrys elegans]|uniref:Fungal-specific transcription factor domain-containing protein n=1 Tax=Stachybotrys elegans TaxID=80388 RepID=A0A8K0SW68_9HYPO|nr:fungal-specific transcription factor domain-containing protein [Stachybotrys elegans]